MTSVTNEKYYWRREKGFMRSKVAIDLKQVNLGRDSHLWNHWYLFISSTAYHYLSTWMFSGLDTELVFYTSVRNRLYRNSLSVISFIINYWTKCEPFLFNKFHDSGYANTTATMRWSKLISWAYRAMPSLQKQLGIWGGSDPTTIIILSLPPSAISVVN